MKQYPRLLPTNRKQKQFHALTHTCLTIFTIHVHQAQISPPNCECGDALLYGTPSYPNSIQAKRITIFQPTLCFFLTLFPAHVFS